MMDDLQFYVLFNSISVISGRLTGDNKRLYAMEHFYMIESISALVGDRTGSARSSRPGSIPDKGGDLFKRSKEV